MSAHRSPRAPRRLIASGALALTLVLVSGACSSDDDGRVVADVLEDDELPTQPAATESTTTTTTPQICEPETPTEVTAEDKPVIEVPEGEAPEDLVIETLREGEGREVAAGDSVQLQYSGALFSDGTEFDTSWDDLSPLSVTVGSGGVIAGFDEGLVGMKVGERRMLTIPSDQAYGAEGSGETIPPDSDLIFVIDLVQICYPDPEATTTTTTTAAEGETTTTAAEGGDETTTTAAEGETTTTVAEDETTTTASE